ncbi:MAG: hypothetical protein ACO1TE_28780 [Prosthecobacter sp.]
MNEIVALSGAEEDIFSHYCDQEEREPGRSDLLAADIAHLYGLLAQNPFMGSRHDSHSRKVILRRWSLGIYYTVEGNRNMIVAVQHLQQDPKKIRAILKARRPG